MNPSNSGPCEKCGQLNFYTRRQCEFCYARLPWAPVDTTPPGPQATTTPPRPASTTLDPTVRYALVFAFFVFGLPFLSHLVTGSKTGITTFTPPVATKAEFDQIQNGMSYEQVKGIVGDPGEKMSESTLPSIGLTSVDYMWKNEDGSSMTIIFQNDKVEIKSQYQLP